MMDQGGLVVIQRLLKSVLMDEWRGASNNQLSASKFSHFLSFIFFKLDAYSIKNYKSGLIILIRTINNFGT